MNLETVALPPANTTLIGIAGVHHVVSELSRRGMIALPTVKNTAAYDIVALNQAGTRHANIQVKASSKKVGFFPMPASDKIRIGEPEFFVLVRWLELGQRYQCYLLTGMQAKAEVDRAVTLQHLNIAAGTRQKPFPCAHVGPGNSTNAAQWEEAWRAWKL
jgi:hypothetical protein